MRPIKIANVPYLVGVPYREVARLPWVDYREDYATANATRLHEREVEVALISSSEYALHGGYVGLDFGVASRHGARALYLCADTDISKLSTIYVFKGASGAAVLLRLLLAERWNCTPRLVRVHDPDLGKYVQGREGALIMDEQQSGVALVGNERHELSSAWSDLTGLPFVYLIWSMRPGVLSARRSQNLSDLFHRAVRSRVALGAEVGRELGIANDALHRALAEANSFYLDNDELAGLREFYQRSARLGLLPEASYRAAAYTIVGRRRSLPPKRRGVRGTLEAAVARRRINIGDAVRVAEEASLADLGLVAESLRTRIYNERHATTVLPLTVSADSADISAAIAAVPPDAERVILCCEAEEPPSLENAEQFVHGVRSARRAIIEGFSVLDFRRIAARENRSVEEVIGRLVAAGLQAVPAFGGAMLIGRTMVARGPAGIRPSEWLDTMRFVHRVGARSSCCMTLDPRDSWEDRMLHLRKLRALQDEVPGFRYFYITESTPRLDSIAPDEALRAAAVARIFLDNVPSIEQPLSSAAATSDLLRLCFGASDIRIDSRGSYDRLVALVRESWGLPILAQRPQQAPPIAEH